MHESWQGVFGRYINTSFMDLVRQEAPDLLLTRHGAPHAAPPAGEPHGMPGVPTATTILALRYAEGVIVAGDRQATEGYQVAHRRIEKVFKTDELLGGRHRRRGGSRHRDGPPVPDGARALREGRGRRPVARGQGEQARPDDPDEPPDGDAGPRGRAHLRGLRSPPGRGPDLQLRRHRRAGTRRADYAATGSGGKDARTTLKKLFRTDGARADALRWAAEALDRRGGGGRRDGRPRLHPRDLPDREGDHARRVPRHRRGRGARPMRGRPGRRGDRGADRCRCPTTSRPSR